MKDLHPLDAGEQKWSYSLWGLWLLIFLGVEFGGLLKSTPWRTLSETAWSLQGRWKLLKLLSDGGLAVLRTHIVNPYWPGSGPTGSGSEPSA